MKLYQTAVYIWLFGFVFGMVVGLAICRAVHVEACCGGPSAQLNPDIYEIAGYPSPKLQTLNPITVRLQGGGRTVRFRYVVSSGCSAGNMRSTLDEAMASTTKVTHVQFIEDNTGYDFTIRANCGVDFTNHCGSAAIACLGRGWPYVADIDAVTTMATFYDLSQVSIWEHELAGHALATWNEQYQLDGNFSATPNLIDFMNTGPDSRYDWPQNDLDRWERTMYLLAPTNCTGPQDAFGNVYNTCTGRWENTSGWSYDPATGIWYNPRNEAEWGACDTTNKDCWNIRLNVWIFKAAPPYDPKLGFLAPPI